MKFDDRPSDSSFGRSSCKRDTIGPARLSDCLLERLGGLRVAEGARQMRNRSRLGRWMAVVAGGGFVFQFVGCASGLVPIVQSVGESVLLSLLVGAVSP